MGMVPAKRSPISAAQPVLGLRARKQAWTKDAIWDAAIDLFAARGFEEVTIDEIADAARVSRRSFFRYFESKNDLMARPIADVTAGIASALDSCPSSSSPGAVLEHVVLALADESAADPRNAKVMKLVVKSPAARQALTSRLLTVQGQIEKAFSRRFTDPLMVQTLSWLTVSALSVGTRHWFANGRRDMAVSTRKALSAIADVGCGLGC
jgi:AcrR family transcriptional regulator